MNKDGFYFVTITTNGHLSLFSTIKDGAVFLSKAGEMIQHEWLNLKQRFDHVTLGDFVIMPDHIHGIIEILDNHKHYNIVDIQGNHKGLPLQFMCKYSQTIIRKYRRGAPCGYPI